MLNPVNMHGVVCVCVCVCMCVCVCVGHKGGSLLYMATCVFFVYVSACVCVCVKRKGPTY